MIWRLILHEKMNVTLLELDTHWTVADVVEAHEVLDIHEALEGEHIEKAKLEAQKGRKLK